MTDFKNILITGASSGLGRALAIEYAGNQKNLFLTGRNQERLMQVKNICEAKGANVEISVIDVTDGKVLKNFIDSADQKYPLELVIANAGISEGVIDEQESFSSNANRIFKTNLEGVLNTIHPAIPLMKSRGEGQIAIVSSLASFKGMPSAPSYSASKAAVRFYGEALRGALQNDGIGVTVICPGFIKTPLTDVNKFPMPFLMAPEKAATIIKARLAKNPPRIAFPLPLYWLINFLSFLPLRLTGPLFSRLPKKGI